MHVADVLRTGTPHEVIAYQWIFGGDLTINHFGDFGTDDHGIGDQVMHGQLETASGLTLMAADMLPGKTVRPGNNLAVSLGGDDTEELRGYWQALSDGGTVTVELATPARYIGKGGRGAGWGLCSDGGGMKHWGSPKSDLPVGWSVGEGSMR